jgi:LacI family transcriptional regulator
MVTLADVATRAGVSISAVSRVLSDSPSARVSAATRDKILRAATDLGYRPNFAARALKVARTKVVGLVVPDLTNPLFTDLLDGAESEAASLGYTLLLGRAGEVDAEAIQRLVGEGRVDGVVVQVSDGVPPAGLGLLHDARTPIVLINSSLPGEVGSVAFDDALGARVATSHLLDLGHQRIAFANGLPRSFTAKRRRRGYLAAMADAGLVPGRTYETRLGYTVDDGRAALARLLDLPERPTAVVVANVNAAMGVLAQARHLGVRVPEDLSVVCVHDAWTAAHTWPPLTAVRMPFHEMGRTAVRAVVRRVETGEMSDDVISSPAPQLVVRESAAPLS